MNLKKHLANRANYGACRATSNIKFIVIHYTANDGDTDENNGKYFANNVVKASAHYFVDDDSVTQSVPDNYIAYAVGGKKFDNCAKTGGGKYYGICTNSNSISIELCDDVKNGVIYPSAKTIANALELVELLCKRYNISKANVIRHFDVTGKSCPAYWVDDEKWQREFWSKLHSAFKPHMVKVTAPTLNVRNKPSIEGKVVSILQFGDCFTVAEEKNGWGKPKWYADNGKAGWVNLGYTVRV